MKKFIRFLVRKIPRPVLIKFSFIFSRIITVFYKGNNVHCPVCKSNFRKFLPYGNKGIDNRLCPNCLTLERHRLIWLFLEKETNFFTQKNKMLHIAPEQPFLKRFKKLANLDYITADLESPLADVKTDIQDMPFNDNEFDIVLCNHVIEHIENEQVALKEVFRVLKPEGWAILQVPLDASLNKTYENPTIKSPEEREKHFGQYDHVRLYGNDYPERLKIAGFEVKIYCPEQLTTAQNVEKYRLEKNEKLYLCIKPKNS